MSCQPGPDVGGSAIAMTWQNFSISPTVLWGLRVAVEHTSLHRRDVIGTTEVLDDLLDLICPGLDVRGQCQ